MGQEKRSLDKIKTGKLRLKFNGNLLPLKKMGLTLPPGAEYLRGNKKISEICFRS